MIECFFRRNATEKSKVGRRNRLWGQEPLRSAEAESMSKTAKEAVSQFLLIQSLFFPLRKKSAAAAITVRPQRET
jgi:hypothetical protein